MRSSNVTNFGPLENFANNIGYFFPMRFPKKKLNYKKLKIKKHIHYIKLSHTMQRQERVFNSQDYLDQYYSSTTGNEEQQMENCQEQWGCEAFDIIPESDSCLELGCGPVLNLAACASRKCRNIYLSEYNTDCFRHISHEMSQDNSKKSFWAERFEIIAKIQKSSAEEVQRRLKERVTACFKCDLRNDKIVVGVEYLKKVDVITSSLAMESAVFDHEDYDRIVKNIKKLLNFRGYLYFFGVLEGSFYSVKEQRLPACPLYEDQIKQSLRNSGFQIIKFNIRRTEVTKGETVNNKGFYSILARSID